MTSEKKSIGFWNALRWVCILIVAGCLMPVLFPYNFPNLNPDSLKGIVVICIFFTALGSIAGYIYLSGKKKEDER